METTTKKFRLSDYVKDGYLAKVLRNDLRDLKPEQLVLAQDAIAEVGGSGQTGTFDELLGEYRRAIRRALHPERKLVKSPQIDRRVIRNPQLAAALDRELEDVTGEELARANAAVKKIIDEARAITIRGGPGEERFVIHDESKICKIDGEHSTLPGAEKGTCGYFRDPMSWEEALRQVVREALAG